MAVVGQRVMICMTGQSEIERIVQGQSQPLYGTIESIDQSPIAANLKENARIQAAKYWTFFRIFQNPLAFVLDRCYNILA